MNVFKRQTKRVRTSVFAVFSVIQTSARNNTYNSSIWLRVGTTRANSVRVLLNILRNWLCSVLLDELFSIFLELYPRL